MWIHWVKIRQNKYNLNLVPNKNFSALSLFTEGDEEATQRIIESSSGDVYVFDKEDSKIMTKEEAKLQNSEEEIVEEDVSE